MKAQIELVLDGNIRLPLTVKMDSLKDVASMGLKIAAHARNVKKLMPDTANAGVKTFKITLAEK